MGEVRKKKPRQTAARSGEGEYSPGKEIGYASGKRTKNASRRY